MNNRIFASKSFEKPQEGEPYRSVVSTSKDAAIIVWHVKKNQSIKPHVHPHGQDTWTVLSGEGQYIFDESSERKTIKKGDIVVAHENEIHGIENFSEEPFVFVSVVSPAEAGYELKEEL